MAIKKIRYDFNLPWLGVYTTDTSKPTDIMVNPNGANVSGPAPDKPNDALVDHNRTKEVTNAKQNLREQTWSNIEYDREGWEGHLDQIRVGSKDMNTWVKWFYDTGIIAPSDPGKIKISQLFQLASLINKHTKMSPGDSIFDGIIRIGLDKFMRGYGITETEAGGTVYIKQGTPIWNLLVKFADKFLATKTDVDLNKVLPSGTKIGTDPTGRDVIVK